MSSDWTVDPAELPPDGERQDMTIDKVGIMQIGPKEQRQQIMVLKCVIDNGEYEGKRVSARLDPQRPQLMNKRMKALDALTDGVFDYNATSLKGAVQPFKEIVERDARLSAQVHLKEFEDESRRGVKYQLSEFGKPEAEPNIRLRSEPTQFKRNV